MDDVIKIGNVSIASGLLAKRSDDEKGKKETVVLKDGTKVVFYKNQSGNGSILKNASGITVFSNLIAAKVEGTDGHDDYIFNNCRDIKVDTKRGTDHVTVNDSEEVNVIFEKSDERVDRDKLVYKNSDDIIVKRGHNIDLFAASGSGEMRFSSGPKYRQVIMQADDPTYERILKNCHGDKSKAIEVYLRHIDYEESQKKGRDY